MKPAMPKYANALNVNVVLNYLELLHPHNKLTLKELSQKLAMLLALLSGRRYQTILKLILFSMKLSSSMCVSNYLSPETVEAWSSLGSNGPDGLSQ